MPHHHPAPHRPRPAALTALTALTALSLLLAACGGVPAASAMAERSTPASSTAPASLAPASQPEAASLPPAGTALVHSPTQEELAAMEGVMTELPAGYQPTLLEGRITGLLLLRAPGEIKGGYNKPADQLAMLTEEEAVGRVTALLEQCCVDYRQKGPARYRVEASEHIHKNQDGAEYSEWTIYLKEVDGLGIRRNTISAQTDEHGRVYSLRFGTPSQTPDEELANRSYLPEAEAVRLALDTLAGEGVSFDWEIYQSTAELWERDGVVRWSVTIGPKPGIEAAAHGAVAPPAEGESALPTPPEFVHHTTYDVSMNAETGADLIWAHCG